MWPLSQLNCGYENAGNSEQVKNHRQRPGQTIYWRYILKLAKFTTTEKTYRCDRRGKIVKLLKEIRVTFFNHSCNDLATHLSLFLSFSLSLFLSVTETHTHKIIFRISTRYWHCVLILNPPCYVLTFNTQYQSLYKCPTNTSAWMCYLMLSKYEIRENEDG